MRTICAPGPARRRQVCKLPAEYPKAEHERLLRLVSEAIDAVVGRSADGRFTPADIGAEMQRRGWPMGMWEVRGVLSDLQARGRVEVDPDTARYSLRHRGDQAQAAGS